MCVLESVRLVHLVTEGHLSKKTIKDAKGEMDPMAEALQGGGLLEEGGAGRR